MDNFKAFMAKSIASENTSGNIDYHKAMVERIRVNTDAFVNVGGSVEMPCFCLETMLPIFFHVADQEARGVFVEQIMACVEQTLTTIEERSVADLKSRGVTMRPLNTDKLNEFIELIAGEVNKCLDPQSKYGALLPAFTPDHEIALPSFFVAISFKLSYIYEPNGAMVTAVGVYSVHGFVNNKMSEVDLGFGHVEL